MGRKLLHVHVSGSPAGTIVLGDEDGAMVVLVDRGGKCDGKT
jgi:hypothetical protein